MKLYLAGSGGMLGTALATTLGETHEVFCTDLAVTEPWLHACDFRDFEAYKASVMGFRPDILLHVGAHTDLEYCEREPADAYRTNTLAVEHAATLANSLRIPLVYISTAGVFDGDKALYDDWDQPNPLGVYARSKYIGETIVQTRVDRHFICRAGWMMGGGKKKDKKFVGKILGQIRAGNKVLKIVDDKFGTPTYTFDFAENLRVLIGTEFYGLYNMVCEGETSRLEVAEEIVRLLRRNGDIAIEPVGSSYFAVDYSAPRPSSERLVNTKLDLRGINHMRHWKQALDAYLSSDVW